VGKNEGVIEKSTGTQHLPEAPSRRQRALRGHRALAGESRVRVLEALRDRGSATVPELAEAVGLAANTVRLHLDRLVEAALVTRDRAEPAGRGRPRQLYTVVADADVSERGYRELARLLADTLAAVGPAAEQAAVATGQTWGAGLIDQDAAGATESRTVDGPAQVVALMDELGFEPELRDDGSAVEMHHCPFRQVAQRHSDVVCALHLGLMQGALRRLGSPVDATRLQPFVTPRTCLAHLGAGPPATRVTAA
jgi:predicted ArsR family transcriptional regulator